MRELTAGLFAIPKLAAKIEVASNGCHLFCPSGDTARYATVSWEGRTVKAHRLSWRLVNGEIPLGMVVCHTCDVPACVNPDHLFIGTHTDNMRDMYAKGRARNPINSSQNHFRAGHAPRGENASAAKMSEEDAVKALKYAAAGVLTKEIAASLGVVNSTVQRLLRGQTWKHLPRPPGLPRPAGRYIQGAGRAILAEASDER